ncbi:MAG TPA: hypothetical protein ENL08_05790 [Bacteroidetes bacterium]|nr:hypothetical protein [Bacteroidota bacterium]
MANQKSSTFRRVFAFILLLTVIIGLYLLTGKRIEEEKPKADLDTPSPALGRTVATAIHQAVTDPYFAPLEKLAQYLSDNPQCDMVTIDQMTKWALDDAFPTCFVWDADGSRIEVDNAASPWAIEQAVKIVRQCLYRKNPRGLLFVETFRAENEKYWLGFLKVPVSAPEPTQIAGVFFSMDRYIEEDVPRFIDGLVSRRRFPLVSFQLNDPPMHNEPDGDISFRILDEKGGIYFQHGREFDEGKMIYAESIWYPKPIVCMQEGWDLQVFSSNAVASGEPEGNRTSAVVILIAALILASLFYWWGIHQLHTEDEK